MATKDDDKKVTVSGPHQDVDKGKNVEPRDAKAAPDESEADPPPPPDYAVVGDSHLGEPPAAKPVPPVWPPETPVVTAEPTAPAARTDAQITRPPEPETKDKS